MKRSFILIAALLVLANGASARDQATMVAISEALNSSNFQEKLDSDIKLYFGKQHHGTVAQKNSSGVVTKKKTNAFNKSDTEACEWVLLSALLAMQNRARNEGANAVINIVSYYKKKEFSSETEVECHAGNVMAGIALKGDVVTLR